MARAGLAVLTALLFLTSPCPACSVPVFRYALERWPPSTYQVVVFHRGALSPAEGRQLDGLRESSRAANLRVTTADLAGRPGADLDALWQREGRDAPLPRAFLRYPDAGPTSPSLWGGPLGQVPLRIWLDSPARRALFDRLTTGRAGVVLLLLSGDAAADDAARRLLRHELPPIAGRIELPARTADGPQVESELPLRVEFPVVEVPRTPEEEGLVRMLLGSEDGLDGVRGPIAFPVFGRGRVLCSLHGRDLEEAEVLRRSLEYLCRACSCQVKELNPGLDLLMAGNWDTVFAAERGPVPREVAAAPTAMEVRGGRTAGLEPAEPRPPPPPGYDPVKVYGVSESRADRTRWFRYAALAAGALVVATGSWAIRARPRVSNRS
jgi:hypothetical protein